MGASEISIGGRPVSRIVVGGSVVYEKHKYAELEYIESTGTQWIDTAVTGTGIAAYRIKLAAMPQKINYEQYFAGLKLPTVPKLYVERNYIVRIQGAKNSINIDDFRNDRTVHVVEYGDTIKVDGKDYEAPKYPWGSVSFYIFNGNEERNLPSCMKLYELQMYSDSILVRDFHPACRIADGELGLLDIVNMKFYTNEGTGSFVAGQPTGRYF